jgi:hypothetical protein
LHREQRSPHIDAKEFVEMLFGDGPKGNKFANAGIGENNIDSPLIVTDFISIPTAPTNLLLLISCPCSDLLHKFLPIERKSILHKADGQFFHWECCRNLEDRIVKLALV